MKQPPRDRDWDKLNPCFAQLIRNLITRARAAGLDVDVFEGYRALERQQWLFRKGRVLPGAIVTSADGVIKQSWHQLGLAADLDFRAPTGGWVAPGHVPPNHWEELAVIGRELGLICGNDWKVRDRAHFEAPHLAAIAPSEIEACRH